MILEQLASNMNIRQYLKDLGVDSGGIEILASKAQLYCIAIKKLHVGGANILKQDALSIGADLAVPRGTVIAEKKEVDCLLIATRKHLKILAKKERAQPFGLQEVGAYLQKVISVKKPEKTAIMGIINANDDSFFSGSRFKDANAIVLNSLEYENKPPMGKFLLKNNHKKEISITGEVIFEQIIHRGIKEIEIIDVLGNRYNLSKDEIINANNYFKKYFEIDGLNTLYK